MTVIMRIGPMSLKSFRWAMHVPVTIGSQRILGYIVVLRQKKPIQGAPFMKTGVSSISFKVLNSGMIPLTLGRHIQLIVIARQIFVLMVFTTLRIMQFRHQMAYAVAVRAQKTVTLLTTAPKACTLVTVIAPLTT
jgi:hypothetical protein